MTILFIEFGIVQYVLRLYYDSGAGKLSHTNLKYRWKYCGAICATISVLILLLILLYSVVITASFFYYYLPLVYVVTDLPNEGVVVYQTALILIGAYITYKTLFREQKKKKDVDIINCQVKENMISQLRTEIKCLKVEGKGGYTNKIKNLNKKILHLQKEIELGLIQSNIACLINEPESSINQRKILHLYKQWKTTFEELKTEIDESSTILETEKRRLQNELLYHLSQLHELTEEQVDFEPINKDLQDELEDKMCNSPSLCFCNTRQTECCLPTCPSRITIHNAPGLSPTALSATASPPTALPATGSPPTVSPATGSPPTASPTTAAATALPPTALPPTISSATASPPTASPPTASPATGLPPTDNASTSPNPPPSPKGNETQMKENHGTSKKPQSNKPKKTQSGDSDKRNLLELDGNHSSDNDEINTAHTETGM